MDKMWSEYAMYSNLYDNNLYFKYKSSQYASQYIKYGHIEDIYMSRDNYKEWLYASRDI
jgi:hypothetical protein